MTPFEGIEPNEELARALFREGERIMREAVTEQDKARMSFAYDTGIYPPLPKGKDD